MRPRFFSKYEWWYHLTMMPVLLMVGNYYFIGSSYFTNRQFFLIGTGLVFLLYWFSIIMLTVVIRWVIARFPEVRQAQQRLLVMLLLVGGLTVFLAIFDVWAYSVTPGLEVQFTWGAIWPILILGGFFDIFFCVALGLFYALEKWKQNQTESEKLERLALQHQFDILKGQVNPHFLFNSLNTLSSLISEDAQLAEDFVEDLAKIYRYMLQAGKFELASLASELEFLEIYTRLLQVRYGKGLQIEFSQDLLHTHFPLAPLSLQTLVDNAIKHNIMSAGKPLKISVVLTANSISVTNNVQRKMRSMDAQASGRLASLIEKYKMLSQDKVRVEQTETDFTVTLPVINEAMSQT